MIRRRPPFTLRPATTEDEEMLGILEGNPRPPGLLAVPKDGVRIIERNSEILGAFRAFRQADRILVAWILIRPEHRSRGIDRRLLRLIQHQADASRFPVELHVLRVDDRALALTRRLGFAVVETGDTHHVLRWEGRRTARRTRRGPPPADRREMTLGPHEWLLLAGSVLAGQQMIPMGVEAALGLSVLVFVALVLQGLRKRKRHGRLLLRLGWFTRTTALILGLAFVAASFTLLRTDHPGAGRAAPLAAGLAILFFTYAPRTMEIRRRGTLLPFRRGWVSASDVRGFCWEGERDDDLVIDLTPDPQTGLPRVYRRAIRRSHLAAVDAALEAMLVPVAIDE